MFFEVFDTDSPSGDGTRVHIALSVTYEGIRVSSVLVLTTIAANILYEYPITGCFNKNKSFELIWKCR